MRARAQRSSASNAGTQTRRVGVHRREVEALQGRSNRSFLTNSAFASFRRVRCAGAPAGASGARATK
jgi:hypothetical protein